VKINHARAATHNATSRGIRKNSQGTIDTAIDTGIERAAYFDTINAISAATYNASYRTIVMGTNSAINSASKKAAA
jgi:hypothetical protein